MYPASGPTLNHHVKTATLKRDIRRPINVIRKRMQNYTTVRNHW